MAGFRGLRIKSIGFWLAVRVYRGKRVRSKARSCTMNDGGEPYGLLLKQFVVAMQERTTRRQTKDCDRMSRRAVAFLCCVFRSRRMEWLEPEVVQTKKLLLSARRRSIGIRTKTSSPSYAKRLIFIWQILLFKVTTQRDRLAKLFQLLYTPNIKYYSKALSFKASFQACRVIPLGV
jgi:hypothetical protein